jgi:ABC-type nickel/cobalt efflux system permease component RcnA
MRAVIRGASAARWRALALGGACVLAVLWLSGWGNDALAALHDAVFSAQRSFQSLLAGGVRALKAGEPWAVANLAWLGFLYGVLHAIGPGHGKVVLGAWAFSAKAKLLRVAGITLAASLAQSLVAIGLVLGGAALFNLGRQELTDLAEGPVTRAGYFMLVALGVWLMIRGGFAMLRALRERKAAQADHLAHYQEDEDGHGENGHAEHGHGEHGHPHSHSEQCGCGHAHIPSPEKAARANLPEAILLIAGVALRPCTGAVFVMLLTLLIGAPVAGALSVMAMGLGTALITLIIALLSAKMGGSLFSGADALAFPLRFAAGGAQLAIGGLLVALYLLP